MRSSNVFAVCVAVFSALAWLSYTSDNQIFFTLLGYVDVRLLSFVSVLDLQQVRVIFELVVNASFYVACFFVLYTGWRKKQHIGIMVASVLLVCGRIGIDGFLERMYSAEFAAAVFTSIEPSNLEFWLQVSMWMCIPVALNGALLEMAVEFRNSATTTVNI